MTSSKSRRAMILFFAIAFGAPWICWSLLAAGIVPHDSAWARPLFYSGDFCSIAGLIAAGMASGRSGVTDLIGRAIDPRAPLLWWVAAIGAPLAWQVCAGAVYLGSHGGIGEIHLRAVSAIASPALLMMFTTGPLGEEFGWRGYLFPRFMRNSSAFAAAIAVGVIWAIWHAPLYLGRAIEDPLWGVIFVANVVLFSLMISAVYLRTGSLLLAIVMHWAINASQEVTPGVLPALGDAVGEASYQLIQLAVLAGVTAFFIPALSYRRRDELLPAGAGSPALAPAASRA
jgi:uncharacterized protein